MFSPSLPRPLFSKIVVYKISLLLSVSNKSVPKERNPYPRIFDNLASVEKLKLLRRFCLFFVFKMSPPSPPTSLFSKIVVRRFHYCYASPTGAYWRKGIPPPEIWQFVFNWKISCSQLGHLRLFETFLCVLFPTQISEGTPTYFTKKVQVSSKVSWTDLNQS